MGSVLPKANARRRSLGAFTAFRRADAAIAPIPADAPNLDFDANLSLE